MLSFFKNSGSEQAIITGLQQGGTERRLQERKLYELFFYFIKRGVLKYPIQEEDAASAYSDTIISVINSIVTGKFEGRSTLKSYAYQIFMNKCVDLVRKDTSHKRIHSTGEIDQLIEILPDKARSIVQGLIAKTEWADLMQKLKNLGEKCRQLLLLFEDGYTDKEIAMLMEYNSSDVVKTSRLRCLDKLKKVYQKLE